MIMYFKLMLLKCSLMMVKCSLMMVKCSSMMVKWVFDPTLTIINEYFSSISLKYTIIRSSNHHWEAAPTVFSNIFLNMKCNKSELYYDVFRILFRLNSLIYGSLLLAICTIIYAKYELTCISIKSVVSVYSSFLKTYACTPRLIQWKKTCLIWKRLCS